MAAVRLPRSWLQSAAAARPVPSSSSTAATVAAGMISAWRMKTSSTTVLPRQTRRWTSAKTQIDSRKNKNIDLIKMLQHGDANRSLLPPFTLPMTLVTPPLSRFPRSPKAFFRFGFLIAKTRFVNFWTGASQKFVSMPGLLSRPKFKIRRSVVVVTAKALHRQMSEAIAAGDKNMLRQICTPELYQQYAGVIDSRPKNQRVEWELVEYTNKLRYPRMADHKVMMIPHPTKKNLMVRQAVVSVSSRQRLCRYELGPNRAEKKIPGSEKTKDIIEHLVVMSEVDNKTFETAPWKVWGTVGETTYEAFTKEIEDIDVLQRAGDM